MLMLQVAFTFRSRLNDILGVTENAVIADVSESAIDKIVKRVVKGQPEAITIFGTSLRAAQ